NFNNDSSVAASPLRPLGDEGGDAGDWSPVPAAYVAVPINKDLALGFGINAPFGLKTEYGDGWMGRYHALKSEITTYNFNPTLAFRLNSCMTLGFGMNYQRLLAELTNSVNYAAAVAAAAPALTPAVLSLDDGRAAVRGDDSAWGFNAGILFNFSDRTRLGFAYRSRFNYDVSGSVRFTAPQSGNAAVNGVIAALGAPGAPLSTSVASVELELPDIATASFTQRIGDHVELMADISWSAWSTVQELRIRRVSGAPDIVTPEHWDDAWRYALGLAVQVGSNWTLRGGVAFDETPVPDFNRTPRLPDGEREWVAIGARWTPTMATVIDVGYAHLFSDDAPINQNSGNTALYGFLHGEQESYVDIVSLQVGYRF
ncbi:MAG TPA: outer membrane protein transport protein, partial [Povalibacter sp.]|nr:outer membrane protein transport protein [Povalibacter sp.]